MIFSGLVTKARTFAVWARKGNDPWVRIAHRLTSGEVSRTLVWCRNLGFEARRLTED